MITENPLYLQLKQIAADGGYTAAQVRDATKDQVAALLSQAGDAGFWSGGNVGFFTALRDTLAEELQRQEDTAAMAALRDYLRTGGRVWFDDNFPDAQFDKGRCRDKRYVILWLDGRPDGANGRVI